MQEHQQGEQARKKQRSPMHDSVESRGGGFQTTVKQSVVRNNASGRLDMDNFRILHSV
jgi:hypothetical protein